ncbi:MAG: dynamin family protein [Pseudomonadota bacterium]
MGPHNKGADLNWVKTMNVENRIEEAKTASAPTPSPLLATSLDALSPILGKMKELEDAISTIADVGDRTAAKSARKLQRQLRKLEPTITMIGQVKAGKTSLVNAMVGWPGLLPADVNPWTSVITSLHISPEAAATGNRASFKFFEGEEWDRLVERGGRIGELAGRAGAEDELQKLTEQTLEMREKSRRRLGDKFELLLGQEHNYGYVDQELVERYVCLGDDFETDTDTSNTQGRFADITKSADLFLQRSEFPIDFCIRDTPGVNDTFMMREQITIRAIRESRICVVVLSAHQALSTVDLALIRLIANIPTREVMIFVNRIDELSDPAAQIPEIEESIRKTLEEHKGPADAEILFGSALWANHVLGDKIDALSEASAAALDNWAEDRLDDTENKTYGEIAWELSGVPAVYRALAARIEAGIGDEAVTKAAKGAMNLVSSITTSEHIVAMRLSDDTIAPLDRKNVPEEFNRIEERCVELLQQNFNDVLYEFETRLDRSHKGFLDRATGSLIAHLEKTDDTQVWHYDATGLRVLLRTAFQVFSRTAQTTSQKIYLQTAAEIRDIYLRAFNVPDETFRLEAPPAPYVPSPVLLGQTIALDLGKGWWNRWWQRRRGYRNYAVAFAEMIESETLPILEGLKADHARAVHDDAREVLQEFLNNQREILTNLCSQAETSTEELIAAGKTAANREKTKALETTTATLTKYAA